ncbi:baseplate J/gp47 family protein [Paenibacillus sp. 11B]|uniref:baseplate J/gp47 family protein n=1 Tax=unclassified Paenibacillus TaxID=185978 RepID=UPI002651FE1D|nr:baseplate J/gp47 family protein [Paenibacillus sp. 11B]MDN8592016.1 baseplate J/gp47 family protein [Paenibacillus sp. 11B]
MFDTEEYEYEAILQRMLDRVPDDLDKRPGSIIYDSLAPAAAEFAQMNIDLSAGDDLYNVDTATGEYLTEGAAEWGVNRKQATFAVRKGTFLDSNGVGIDVAIGSRFFIEDLNYVVKERVSLGVYKVTAETAGVVGNAPFGSMLPVEYINDLATATLSDILVPGEDEETDDQLRERFFIEINEQPFGGNVADYRQMIRALDGVGAVRITPVWQGGGSVKATIMATGHVPPSTALINQLQEIVDPVAFAGQGIGLAPIGHTVTLDGVNWFTINITTTLTLDSDTSIGQVQQDVEDVIDGYLQALKSTWESDAPLIIRVAPLESRILTVSGVVDVIGTQLNGSTANITLTVDQVPQRGRVTLNE